MAVKSENAADSPNSLTAQQTFLENAYAAAKAAGCIFPEYAACEAALASNYGQTPSAKRGNNLFNFRVPAKAYRQSGNVRTVPVDPGKGINARLAFGSYADCFAYRADHMAKVTMYYLARRAKTGYEYLAEMARLSPDPQYRPKIQAIYTANEAILQ